MEDCFQTHQIIALTAKLEKLKNDKLECIREATACRQELESKQSECEMLREKLAQIEEANDTLSKSYEKTIRVTTRIIRYSLLRCMNLFIRTSPFFFLLQHLREKNKELKNQIFDLQIQRSVESPSDVVSLFFRFLISFCFLLNETVCV